MMESDVGGEEKIEGDSEGIKIAALFEGLHCNDKTTNNYCCSLVAL